MIKRFLLSANKQLFLLAALALLLTACAGQVRAPEALVQGKKDQRQYRYMALDNGLKVLLISDFSADTAAASVNVLVGSGNDPLHRQGLAHFLEHMLFLGTAKYPTADEYQRFISENAGQHNAYTAFDHTNYFFTVKPDALVPALDRFADFFVNPLLDEAYIQREQHAVHSEYNARLRDEGRRQLDVIKTLVDQSHPFAKFSIGNLTTLSSGDKPVRDDLLQFYQRYYVANNMTLSVIAPMPLDALEVEVRSRFSLVRHAPDFGADVFPEQVFADGVLPRQVFIQPEKNIKQLQLVFPMPEVPVGTGANSQELLAHILGHEGAGSLHAYLMSKGLIESLSAGSAWQFKGGSAFNIGLGLTPLGMLKKEDVIEAVFEAIAVLKQQRVPGWIFEELALNSQLNFDYGKTLEPVSAVIQAANNLQNFAPTEVLRGDAYYSAFDRKEFNQLVQRLTIDNALIVIAGDNFEADQKSPYHFVPYRQQPLTDAFVQKISQVKPNNAIRLPERNPYLPKNLKLQEERHSGVPERIKAEPSAELWYKPLDRFLLPQASSFYSVIQPRIYSDQSQVVLLDLYSALLNDHLTEVVYPASFAGMSFKIYPHMRGLTLRIDGFSDKQGLLLEAIAQGFKEAQFTPAQFERIRYQLLTRWQNVEKNAPYQRAVDIVDVLLLEHGLQVEEKILLLEKVSFADIERFAAQFTEGAYVRSMNSGNLSRDQAIAMQKIFTDWVVGSAIKPMPITVRGIDASYQHVITTPHSDAVYALYWQGQDNSAQSQVKWQLLGQTLESGFFNYMRTEKQLGYIVMAGYNAKFTVPGIFFMIQSPVANADQLHPMVIEWRKQQLAALTAISDADFAQHKAAVMQSLQEKAKTSEQEATHYWYELAMGFAKFDYQEQLEAALSALDKTQWIAFIEALQQETQPAQLLISTPSTLLDGFTRMKSAESLGVQKRYSHH